MRQSVIDDLVKFLIQNQSLGWGLEEVIRQIFQRHPTATELEVAAAFEAANAFLGTEVDRRR